MTGDQEYEYQAMLASTWDLLRGDPMEFPDRQFYWDIVRDNGEPVLDVGCGTGRLLLEFMARGIEIEGIDVSPEMIDICRQKAQELSLEPVLYVEAIEAMKLPRRYRTIMVPSCTFQLVTDPPAAQAALARFHDHLLPGGLLVMSIWHVKRDGLAEWSDWYLVAEKKRPEDGRTIRRQERSIYDPQTQLRHTENRYEVLDGDQVIYSEEHRRSPELRNYTLAQLVKLLQESGYSEVRAVSGFSTEPATEEDGTFSIMASKAG